MNTSVANVLAGRPFVRRAGFARGLAAASAVALALLLPAGAGVAAGAGPARHTAAANRRAAQHDATTLLRRLALPSGTEISATEPTGDARVLARPGSGSEATLAGIDRHRWWTATGRYASVTAFIRAHPPNGAKLVGAGSSVQGPGLPVGQFLAYQWPAVAGVLWSRQLVIVLVDLPGDRTGVRADAQVQWTIPRPASERIPVGAHELDVARGLPGRAPTLRAHVIDLAQIRRLAGMIDRLQTVQRGAWSCPSMQADTPIVTFTFRARLGGPALAAASEPAFATHPTTPCDPMTFSIRGHARKPLLGGAAVVRAAGRMLGLRLGMAIRLS